MAIDYTKEVARNNLFTEKTVSRMRLTKNKQGGIFIGPYEFLSEAEVLNKINGLMHSKSFSALVNKGVANTWLRALIYQMGEDWHFKKYGSSIRFHHDLGMEVDDHADNRPTINDVDTLCIRCEGTGDPDHSIYIGFSMADFAAYLADEGNYEITSRSHELDPHKLAMAMPEATIFNASYPLNKQQARVLRTILSNIHLVDLDNFFTSILPTYVEARGSSLKRRGIEREGNSDEQFYLALIDQEEIEDYTTNPEVLTTLPTLKECMSKEFVNGG